MKITIEASDVCVTPKARGQAEVEMEVDNVHAALDSICEKFGDGAVIDFVGSSHDGEQLMIQFLQQNGYVVKGVDDE